MEAKRNFGTGFTHLFGFLSAWKNISGLKCYWTDAFCTLNSYLKLFHAHTTFIILQSI